MNFIEQLKSKDVNLFKGDPNKILSRLGWVDYPKTISIFQDEIQTKLSGISFSYLVILGMGGSSLFPDVLKNVFQKKHCFVLDTTDPQTILEVESNIDLNHTLFLVSSKSGSTLEVSSLYAYFYEKVKNPKSFIFITDPQTPFETLAKNREHLLFLNPPEIGGRFSALSFFGLVPAFLMHISLPQTLVADLDSKGFEQGMALGEFLFQKHQNNKNHLWIDLSAPFKTFGYWVEQLVAESTGKNEKGILPVLEFKGPSVPQNLCKITNQTPTDAAFEIAFKNPSDVFLQTFVWMVATAYVGHKLQLNPFDEPNVTLAKEKTKQFLANPDKRTEMPLETLSKDQMFDFLKDIRPTDYIAILGFLPYSQESELKMQTLKNNLERQHNVSITTGYGPRYLHSTGQYHKGGPKNGRFIILVSKETSSLAIPQTTFTFNDLILAQALGDQETLKECGQKTLIGYVSI